MIVDLIWFKAELETPLAKGAATLPVSAEKLEWLSKKLDHNDYAFLVINDTVNYEVVKVGKYNKDLFIERGLEDTRARNFPAGSCVTYVLTLQAVADYIASLPKC